MGLTLSLFPWFHEQQMLELGFDSSADEHLYGIEWDANKGECLACLVG
jgi:hypothetical protein